MIGDQLKREPVPPRYSDPDEPLAGKCASCKTVVSCFRRDARPGSGKQEFGNWNDLISTECPNCKAKVFLMPAVEFGNLRGVS